MRSTQLFGKFFLLVLVTAVISTKSLGWSILPVTLVGLYYVLHFFNELDRRNIGDRRKRR